jgi:multidrug efflux pump subunit AcrA (membrane-fusion protein)
MMKNLLKLKNLYALIFITALAYGGYYFGTQNTEDNTSSKTLELTTISIQKGDLAKKEEYNGTLRQTDKKILNSPTNGVVTFLPKEGSVVNFGEVLFIIDNKPVILLQGTTPFYRTLDLNSDPGVDILQVEEALVYLGYADSTFVPDEVFDEQTSKMLNTLYIDYGIDTKSEITPTEQVLINQKQDEIELLENTVSDGGTTLSEVNNKKKLLDDAKENATKENAAWQAAENEIERIRNLIDELTYESMSEDTRAGRKGSI